VDGFLVVQCHPEVPAGLYTTAEQAKQHADSLRGLLGDPEAAQVIEFRNGKPKQYGGGEQVAERSGRRQFEQFAIAMVQAPQPRPVDPLAWLGQAFYEKLSIEPDDIDLEYGRGCCRLDRVASLEHGLSEMARRNTVPANDGSHLWAVLVSIGTEEISNSPALFRRTQTVEVVNAREECDAMRNKLEGFRSEDYIAF